MKSRLPDGLSSKENVRVEVAVSELKKGDALNWATHKALGIDLVPFLHRGRIAMMDVPAEGMPMPYGAMRLFSESWKDGGSVVGDLLESGLWRAQGCPSGVEFSTLDGSIVSRGVDALEAACLAKVESVLGKVIAIPAYFLNNPQS